MTLTQTSTNTVHEKTTNDVLLIHTGHRLNAYTAASFAKNLLYSICRHHKQIWVDMRHTKSIDCCALGHLIELDRTLSLTGRHLILQNPSAPVQHMLELSRAKRFLTIKQSCHNQQCQKRPTCSQWIQYSCATFTAHLKIEAEPPAEQPQPLHTP